MLHVIAVEMKLEPGDDIVFYELGGHGTRYRVRITRFGLTKNRILYRLNNPDHVFTENGLNRHDVLSAALSAACIDGSVTGDVGAKMVLKRIIDYPFEIWRRSPHRGASARASSSEKP